MIPTNEGGQEIPIEEKTWLGSYFLDFKKRMLNLLGYEFRSLPCSLAFQFIGEKNANAGQTGEAAENQGLIDIIDRKDLEA